MSAPAMQKSEMHPYTPVPKDGGFTALFWYGLQECRPFFGTGGNAQKSVPTVAILDVE